MKSLPLQNQDGEAALACSRLWTVVWTLYLLGIGQKTTPLRGWAMTRVPLEPPRVDPIWNLAFVPLTLCFIQVAQLSFSCSLLPCLPFIFLDQKPIKGKHY